LDIGSDCPSVYDLLGYLFNPVQGTHIAKCELYGML